MGLKAGWLALFIFVWIIGAFLGSTFEYQSSEGEAGVAYSIGTATFTTDSDVVTSGGGAVWAAAMEGGNIQLVADGIWGKMKHVGGGYLINGTGTVTDAPLTLAVGANTPTVETLGTLTIWLPAGNTGTATSGVCTVVGSPVALVADNNTIDTVGVDGGINITVVGSTVVYLYVPYTGTGGAGAYIMAVSPGWAGTGSGGYGQAPITTLDYLLNVSNVVQRVELLGAIPFPVPNGDYFDAAFKVLTWQWSFLAGYGMFYWIFCAPFITMGVLSMILLVYGVLTGNLTF